ncbi:hypothetical protein LOC71_04250 [Rhodopirellula sp. JC740]|uniref:Uncharacterized protein n=1 Tax=Rhodopirellula halodulae TaxID=2894198 RepID=A0ABS8NF49_9BACT|nr:hypothetical protein [Rhodopirellula sp. JC740]MCC9641473.1 hypothetical protein [Rhodopirellula sp. JC740]
MNTLNDQSLSVVAGYLHRCGHHHPDNVRDRSHHFVGLAKQRLQSQAEQAEAAENEQEQLPRVTLEVAMEELFFHPAAEFPLQGKRRRQVIPQSGLRVLRPNETPALIGPLRPQWWAQMAARHIQQPIWNLMGWVDAGTAPQPEAMTDGQ